MEMKTDIRSISLKDIEIFCRNNNMSSFRSKQINEWIWKKRAVSFNEMTSISQKSRIILDKHFIIKPVKINTLQKSIDGTVKYSFILYDNLMVEGVLIPSKNRITACISSQVGCSLTCAFCATGKLKMKRNLDYPEIYDQVYMLNEEAIKIFDKPISNIVYMGMGEPLLNYSNLISSIHLITSNDGLGMSPRRITVSTAGIAKMITKLADDNVSVNIAVSLHSAIDNKRNNLMPINEKINLLDLKNSINYYYQKTKKRITYEYILFENINDSIFDAKKLAEFAKISPCKINIIEYNNVEDTGFKKTNNKNTILFIKFLEERNLIVNLRRSKGGDIDAACGQLINKLNT